MRLPVTVVAASAGLAALSACSMPDGPPPEPGPIATLHAHVTSTSDPDSPELLTVFADGRDGVCASFVGATATVNGVRMEVTTSEPWWMVYPERWECGAAMATLDLAALEAAGVIDGEAPNDMTVVIQGPHVDARVDIAGVLARHRIELLDEEEGLPQIERGRSVRFSVTPDVDSEIGFVTIRDDATESPVDLVVGRDGEDYRAWVPEDAPLGPTKMNLRVDFPRDATVCTGADACDFIGYRVDFPDVNVIDRPSDVEAESPPAAPLYPR